MIIGPALALACGLVANLLLRMITISLKTLSTVAATVMLHQAAPEENGRGSFSPEAPLNAEQLLREFSAYCAVAVPPPMWPPVYRCQPSKEGMTSEFERRVWSRQRPYDYAVQSDLQNQQIIQLTIGIGGSSAAQLRVTIHSALQPASTTPVEVQKPCLWNFG
jgi:hypothetical protein